MADCSECGGGDVDGRAIHMHDCPYVERQRTQRRTWAEQERRRRRRERFDPRWRWNWTGEGIFCAVIGIPTAIGVLLVFAGVIK
jgi:hypothetical protein